MIIVIIIIIIRPETSCASASAHGPKPSGAKSPGSGIGTTGARGEARRTLERAVVGTAAEVIRATTVMVVG